ncbi:MAG TPA: hypothetical protein VFC73_00100 [Syntrophomonadaceae bacterium]|nr:hypothetical protein [Syntrophomonadaceae bacterium]
MIQCSEDLYSNDENAIMLTIPEAKEFLKGAMYFGPVTGPDTKLYEKKNKWYQVTLPCLACLGLTEYNYETAIVEILEVSME